MKKSRIKSSVKYLREISIVVIGITITFTVSNWIGRQSQKKDMERYLNAVKIELKDNLEVVKEKAAFYDRTRKFSKYLLSDNPENLNSDSLASFSDVINYCFDVVYKTSAFEMFKTSGTMRLADDEMLKAILNSYALMEEAKSGSDKYMARKLDELFNTFTDIRSRNVGIKNPRNSKLFYFFAIDSNAEEAFWLCSEQIDATLSLLDKSK